jgi:hypothetical protein
LEEEGVSAFDSRLPLDTFEALEEQVEPWVLEEPVNIHLAVNELKVEDILEAERDN